MAKLPQLDHTVINARYDMDRAAEIFGSLGFSLTARGYHSMGSINHLMMFGTDYLELIGLPPGMENPLPHVAEAPLGINGLVFKTTDVDADYARLQALGLAGDPPRVFSRPLKLPEGEFPVRFKTVQVKPGVFPGGRVYFCEHGTPELVWRPEWQNHRNGVRAIREFVVVSPAFEREAEQFANLLESDVSGDSSGVAVALSGARITLLPPASYGERYGDLASPMAGRDSIFGALVFQTDSLDTVRAIMGKTAAPIGVVDEKERVVVREPTFNCVLEFSESFAG